MIHIFKERFGFGRRRPALRLAVCYIPDFQLTVVVLNHNRHFVRRRVIGIPGFFHGSGGIFRHRILVCAGLGKFNRAELTAAFYIAFPASDLRDGVCRQRCICRTLRCDIKIEGRTARSFVTRDFFVNGELIRCGFRRVGILEICLRSIGILCILVGNGCPVS